MSDPFVVLYAEDEETDVLLMRLALKRSGLPCVLMAVSDGAEAIDYLSGNGDFADRARHPLPCLVLLDLKMPRKTGFEVLSWMRQQEQFARLPVIIYTSSGGEDDRERARALGATEYTVKKADVGDMAEWLRGVIHYCEPEPAQA
ncbi:MAG TPA: response regulator [Candidatus Acidoferrum sp.]|nr:response regulator [Candidatus Acidoferrum sp.]